jgi:ribosomal protein S27AE
MATKMICRECGVEMNHHADKLIEPTSREEAARVDPALGGIVEEHHACPECGKGQARPG